MPRTYEEFVLDLSPSETLGAQLRVVRSAAGECVVPYTFPYDSAALAVRLKDLQIALLRSGGTRRKVLLPEETTVRDFGAALYNSIFTGEVRSLWEASRRAAEDAGHGLRLRLRIQMPHLAALPWEFLFDERLGDFVALASDTPIVRHLPLSAAAEPLAIQPPLRVLGMIAAPAGLAPIDVRAERATVETALRRLTERGIVELHWVEGQSWRALRQRIREEPWHVVHFMGHGGFDPTAREGLLYFAGDDGHADPLTATELNRILSGNQALRLVILNACQGAESDEQDIFSSTAATLARGGAPAVVAMQYEITDAAATEFSRTFYEALVDGLPVDAAVDEARRAISVSVPNSLEWGIPVLFMRSPDGRIFTLDVRGLRAPRPPLEPPPVPAQPVSAQPAPVLPAPIPIPAPPEQKTPLPEQKTPLPEQKTPLPEQKTAPVTAPVAAAPSGDGPPRARHVLPSAPAPRTAPAPAPSSLTLEERGAPRTQSRLWWLLSLLAGAFIVAAVWYAITSQRPAAVLDSDNDGLPDDKEIALNIDPYNNDWDGDGLLDGVEVNETGTDPRSPDSDGDGLKDRAELATYHTDPLKADSDGDGIDDRAELTETPAMPSPSPSPSPASSAATSTPRPRLTLAPLDPTLLQAAPSQQSAQQAILPQETADALVAWNTARAGDFLNERLFESGDPEQCMALCRDDALCKSWTIAPPGDVSAWRCTLFQDEAGSYPATGSVSGLRGEWPGRLYWEYGLIGTPIDGVIAPDPLVCNAACRQTDGCIAWTFMYKSCDGVEAGACLLYSQKEDLVFDVCSVAGQP